MKMMAVDIYRPGQWHDFFLLVGTGAVTLTGLIFVALSLKLNVISQDLTHRWRAIGALTGLAAVFVRCALVLIGGQSHRAVGAELLIVSALAGAVYVNGYVQAVTSVKSISQPSLYRTICGSICYLAEMVGAMDALFAPIIGITLVLISVFLPAAFLPGMTGRMYAQFALVIAATALLSAVNAVTLKPTQCALWLRPPVPMAQRNWFYRGFNSLYGRPENGYVRLIGRMAEHSNLSVIAALILALRMYFFVRLIGQPHLALSHFGLSFVRGNDWAASRNFYHGLPLGVGTLIPSATALRDVVLTIPLR